MVGKRGSRDDGESGCSGRSGTAEHGRVADWLTDESDWGRSHPQHREDSVRMPRRPEPARLGDQAREILEEGLLRSRDAAMAADQQMKIDVFRAYDRGMTVREIAVLYDIAPATVTRWKDEGRALVEQKERGRERSGSVVRSSE